MSATNYLENKLLDHALATTAFTKPTAVYVGLFTADPTDTGSQNDEVTGNGYARQVVTFGAAAGGVATNSSAVTFPEATASWGTITHLALFDSETNGNMLFSGALTNAAAVDANTVFSAAVGAISVSMD